MPETKTDPCTPRDFAVKVVLVLRAAGHEALWAGGCVRDDLLGIAPKDYDVATTATPQQVIELFGKRRTVPVGVSFGVVMVLGPNRGCGQIEVATFRADGEYLDGRRPDSVQFCSAKEDARRRDFTINGMFYDPIAEEVIDYVGGRQDLTAGVVRAIGDPSDRFAEDKLRMLRAVRFAATFQFSLDAATAAAITSLRTEISQVSVERIAQELRRMLAHSTRAASMQKLIDVGLHETVFSPLFEDPRAIDDLGRVREVLQHLQLPALEPSLCAVFASLFEGTASKRRDRTVKIADACRKLKLSNQETEAICWIAEAACQCRDAERQPLHVIKPILSDSRAALLLDYLRASSLARAANPADADYLRAYSDATPAERLCPAPLIDGTDVRALGVEPGPIFKDLLEKIRHEQLDELLANREAALQRLQELAA
jgi:poly(A) polymerase